MRQDNYRKCRLGKDKAGDCRLFQHSVPGKAKENDENVSQDSSWVRVVMKMVSVN